MLSRSSAPAVVVRGMLGIGDCLHQRAILRDLMRHKSVHLHGYYLAMNHDLIAGGMRFATLAGGGRIRDGKPVRRDDLEPRTAQRRQITYTPAAVVKHGSILAAMYASAGLTMPDKPDFSLPVPQAWRAMARDAVPRSKQGGKPLMVLRQIVQNQLWSCPPRAPDPLAYRAIFNAVRERFFVVSVMDRTKGAETIVGPELPADLQFHKGELAFESLAGLFAEADLVFGNPGFAPVLAQAVGTPSIVVYGGHESFRHTNAAGAHLAPTLAIEPDQPCEMYGERTGDKTITIGPAVERARAFVATIDSAAASTRPQDPRVLIFGTSYVADARKAKLLDHWIALNRALNSDCDLLIVDSASPAIAHAKELKAPLKLFRFDDNIGHLARGGRDGWGRAFSYGIEAAIAGGYDYVAHIETDSLFRFPLAPIAREMQARGVKAASVPVKGTRQLEVGWVETGLMMFDVGYLKASDFVRRYDWRYRKRSPTPEAAICKMLGSDLAVMPWRAARGDDGAITPKTARNYDWITHCADTASYEAFVASVLGKPDEAAVKINLGCGTNKLPGWANYDAEIDITKPLPFAANYADCIFAEHVVEHVDYHAAMRFFAECHRVLKPGGIVRIAVPSIENVYNRADQDYCKFVHRHKWAPTADKRGALHAIVFKHGHLAAWSEAVLEASLYCAGFDELARREPGVSGYPELEGVEGHGRVIGEHMNWIETAVVEGIADK